MTQAMVVERPALTGGLGYDDVVALRMADSVVFSHYQGAGVIRAHLDDPVGGRVFTEREQRMFPLTGQCRSSDRAREIHVETGMFGWSTIGVAWRAGDDTRPAGFHMIGSARTADAWQTVAHLLREGDRLSLGWAADNNTDTLRSHGLHEDELRLIVVRPGATRADGRVVRDRRLVFHVATRVCEDNSARMIRRHG